MLFLFFHYRQCYRKVLFIFKQTSFFFSGDRQGAHLAAKLADFGHRVICTAGQADVRATLTCLVAKIQKFCNTKTQNPHHVKVALVGSDTFVNQVLRPYVELFSSKPPDWQGFIKFFIIPLGINR